MLKTMNSHVPISTKLSKLPSNNLGQKDSSMFASMKMDPPILQSQNIYLLIFSSNYKNSFLLPQRTILSFLSPIRIHRHGPRLENYDYILALISISFQKIPIIFY